MSQEQTWDMHDFCGREEVEHPEKWRKQGFRKAWKESIKQARQQVSKREMGWGQVLEMEES